MAQVERMGSFRRLQRTKLCLAVRDPTHLKVATSTSPPLAILRTRTSLALIKMVPHYLVKSVLPMSPPLVASDPVSQPSPPFKAKLAQLSCGCAILMLDCARGTLSQARMGF